jgi:hypothetical protein
MLGLANTIGRELTLNIKTKGVNINRKKTRMILRIMGLNYTSNNTLQPI